MEMSMVENELKHRSEKKEDVGCGDFASLSLDSIPSPSKETLDPEGLNRIVPTASSGATSVRLYVGDRAVQFDDDGRLDFGRVAINRKEDTRIEWESGALDYLERLPENGLTNGVKLKGKVAVLDRPTVGYGSKVSDGRKLGVVMEKHFKVTCVFKDYLNLVLRDIPAEDLIRSSFSRKNDKIVYKDEWIGLTVDTKAGLNFKMDRDGRRGYTTDCTYGTNLPRPGEKIKNMGLKFLWDAKWEPADGEDPSVPPSSFTAWWTFLKHLGNSAEILETIVDCVSVAWMGHVDDGVTTTKTYPPNALRSEEVAETKYLYGRNWKYLKEKDCWGYKLKAEDNIISYADWVRDMTSDFFFGLQDDMIEIDGEDKEGAKIEMANILSEVMGGGTMFLNVVTWRSELEIAWDDGTTSTLPSHVVQPYYYLNDEDKPIHHYYVGEFVKEAEKESSKYGMVVNVFKDHALVKWIQEGANETSSEMCLFKDLSAHPDFEYLRHIHQLPVVIPKKRDSDGRRIREIEGLGPVIGTAVGINTVEAKIVVRGADGLERLVWPHDLEHFVGDVRHNPVENKWIPWNNPDYYRPPEEKEQPEKEESVSYALPPFAEVRTSIEGITAIET